MHMPRPRQPISPRKRSNVPTYPGAIAREAEVWRAAARDIDQFLAEILPSHPRSPFHTFTNESELRRQVALRSIPYVNATVGRLEEFYRQEGVEPAWGVCRAKAEKFFEAKMKEAAPWFEQEVSKRGTLPRAQGADDTILYVGGRRYQLGQKQVTVTDKEDKILQTFLVKNSMDNAALVHLTGDLYAARVVRSLRRKYGFGNAIAVPGKRGAGGYFVRIRDKSAGAQLSEDVSQMAPK
jgi:hypothetical protein